MQENQNNPRQAWLSLLAKSPTGQVTRLLNDLGLATDFEWLRQPEIGSVMMRGRIGGTGAPFNVGEMTVTRCSLKLADGVVGHGYVQGRRKPDAQAAALVDALMQTDRAAQIQTAILDPIEHKLRGMRETRARKAAATKVDFFTMARGED